ncbi:MAG TPA: RIO1 family regulatory kinase/ATPase [Herpetosiphonaceae bacterium]
MPPIANPSNDDLEFDSPEDQPRRYTRKQTDRHKNRPTLQQIVQGIAEPTGLEGGFVITYQPARFEEGWLLDSLRPFYEQDLITDVLASVKGGKEASVYRCQADPSTGETLLAAKVYRPRQFRNLRNDKMYTQGRTILTDQGRAVKASDQRIMRAIGKNTAFGQQVKHTSWLMYEYVTLEQLHAAGAAVPKPWAAGENAILMGYVGDEGRAAPTLHEIQLPRARARAIFDEVIRNIDLMLQRGWIHGDLSAYNILYWQDAITLIDFPQVTKGETNKHAREILGRDIARVCDYFSRYGVASRPAAIADELWGRYLALDPDDEEADWSRFEE